MTSTTRTAKTTKEKKKRLILLDTHAILHRAYHALPDFTSPTGEPTGALYGLCLMLLKIADELHPDYIVACYDLPEPTHRHTAYEAYKAGRAKTDDALVAQIIRSKEIFHAFSIPCYEKAGFEADDILGTIAKLTKKDKHLEVIIASGDMDTMQLVEDGRVFVYTLRKGLKDTILYDEAAVKERFGFGPDLLVDFKGLRGDPSDNIIGVPGIGEKTATELITQFGTIEEILKQIKKDETVLTKAGIKKRIVELLKEHEEEALFSKALATIHRDVPISFSLPEKRWEDTVDWSAAHAMFVSFGFKSLIDRTKSQATLDGMFHEEEKAEELDPQQVEEVAVALWVLDSERTNPKLEDIYAYAGERNFAKAKEKIFAALKKENLWEVFTDIERPLLPLINTMQRHGVLIDRKYLASLSKKYHQVLEKCEHEIYAHAGEEFNINSPRQLGTILYDKLGLTSGRIKKTGTGAKSTKESELQKLRALHPIVDEVLKYREIQKLLSTYIDTIPTLLDAESKLHARFLQAGAATGRMASEGPNLQNIPIRTDLGRAIRKAFIAPPGFVLLSFDYSQIELRVAAVISKDAKLIEIFKSGEDIHAAVAAEVFGVPKGEVTKEMRRRAKIINFGILYGMGVSALQANLGGTREEAQAFLDAYFVQFPGLHSYIETTKREVAKTGYTTTLFGRKRRFPEIKSRLPYLKAAAERMAVNAPIQGTQADIIKIAMAKIDSVFREAGMSEDVHTILQVHDELVFEVRREKLEEAAAAIKTQMENVLPLEKTAGIPLLADGATGNNWEEMEDLG